MHPPPLVILAVFVMFIFISPDASAISMQIITNTGAAWLVEDENTYDDSSPNNAPDVNFIFANQTSIKGLGIGAKIVTFDFDTSTLIHGEEQVGIERAVRPVNNIDTDTRFAALLNIDDDVIRYPIELNKEYIWGDTTGLEDLPTEIDENNILSYGTEYSFGVSDPNPSLLWITRHSPAEESTTRGSLIYDVRFDESVTNVDAADFRIAGITSTVITMSGSGESYKITAEADIDGTYNLDLINSHGIIDIDGNGLSSVTPLHADESYIVDGLPAGLISDMPAESIPLNTPPELLSIERYQPANENTNAEQLTFKVTFNKNVTGVDVADFKLLSDIPLNIPSADDTRLTTDNADPAGIVQQGGKYWVVDSIDNKVYVYDSNWYNLSDDNFDLNSSNTDACGITFYDNKFYIVDTIDRKVYQYRPDGTYITTFTLNSANTDACGITFSSDTSRFYVTDIVDGKAYGYSSSGYYSASYGFDLAQVNNNPYGITFTNGKFWITDQQDAKVYAYAPDGTYLPSNDFDLDADNDTPIGIEFYDGEFHLSDRDQDKIYSYEVYSVPSEFYGSPTADQFDLSSDNTRAVGVTLYGSKFYIVDNDEDKVFTYVPSTGAASTGSFTLDINNEDPAGITYYNNRFYVVDQYDYKVYVYSTSGTRYASGDFNLDSDNDYPTGIYYYGSRIYVLDESDHKVYAYTTAGVRDDTKDFDLSGDGNWSPRGMVYHDSKFWITDQGKVYTYDSAYGLYMPDDIFNLDGDNYDPYGIIVYNSKFYVVDSSSGKMFSYYMVEDHQNSNVNRAYANELEFHTDSAHSWGISHSLKYHIVDYTDDKFYTYDDWDLTHRPADDFTLTTGNNDPRGTVYSSNYKLYVVDYTDNKVYVYDDYDGSHLSTDDFNLDSLNTNPAGITVDDNGNFYIIDTTDKKVYGYDSVGTRLASNDFTLPSLNANPQGIVFNDDKFYIVDSTDRKIYGYDSDGTPDPSLDFKLALANAAPRGIEFYDGKFQVVDQTDKKTYAYEIREAAIRVIPASVEIREINVLSLEETAEGYVYYVTIESDIDRMYDLDLKSSHGITDLDGTVLTSVTPVLVDETYTKGASGSNTEPQLISIERYLPDTETVLPTMSVKFDTTISYVRSVKNCEEWGEPGEGCVSGWTYPGRSYYAAVLTSPDGERKIIDYHKSVGTVWPYERSETITKTFTFTNTTNYNGDWSLKIYTPFANLDGNVRQNAWILDLNGVSFTGNGGYTNPSSIRNITVSGITGNEVPLIYKVTFDKPITGLDATDFVLSPSSTGGSMTSIITENNTRWSRSGETEQGVRSVSISSVDPARGPTITINAVSDTHPGGTTCFNGDKFFRVFVLSYPGGTRTNNEHYHSNYCYLSHTFTLPNFHGGNLGSYSGTYSASLSRGSCTGGCGFGSITDISVSYTKVTLVPEYISRIINTTITNNPISEIENVDGQKYLLTVIAPSEGTYNLDLKTSHGITDSNSNSLSNIIPTTNDQTFTVDLGYNDTTAPTLTSITKIDEESNNRIQTFEVIFSEIVNNADKSAFNIIGDGSAEIIDIERNGNKYTITVITYTGTDFNLKISPGHTIEDLYGNPLVDIEPTTQETINLTPPTIAPTPTYQTGKQLLGSIGTLTKTNDEITAVGTGHYILDLDYLDEVTNIKFTGTVTDATFNIVRIDEVSESHGETPRYSSIGMIDYDEMDPNIDGLYMEFILPTSNSEIIVSAHSIVPVSHFFKITDLPDDTPWEIRQDGLSILRGVTDGSELILHEHEFPVINLDGTFEFILYPNSMIWTDDFSTIILDKYHDQEIHIDTTEDRIYIVHAYVNVPITGNITVTNIQLVGRDANVTNLPLNYLEGTYDEPIFIPVVPNYKGFSLMLDNVTASMEYKDVLNAPSVQIADPSERIEIVRNYTNPSTYGESTTGTVAYYVATDDSVKMQIVMSIDGSLEIQNNYLGCTVRETDENTPWKIRDPLHAWAEVYVNGEQRSFNGTDRIFLGENEFPSTAQKFFNGTHTLEVIDDDNFNILSNTNLLPLDSSIDVPECTLESFQITSYELEGLEEGKIYKVKMKPRYDGSSNGVWSNEVSIMTMSTGGSAIPPMTASANIPSSNYDMRNLTLESNEPGTITVSWTAPVNVPDKDYRLQWAKYIDNYISFTEDNFFEGNAWPAPEEFSLVRNTLFEYPTFLIVGAVQVDDLEPGDIVELFVYAQIYGGVDEVYEAPANVDILKETGWAKATVEIISASVSLD